MALLHDEETLLYGVGGGVGGGVGVGWGGGGVVIKATRKGWLTFDGSYVLIVPVHFIRVTRNPQGS